MSFCPSGSVSRLHCPARRAWPNGFPGPSVSAEPRSHPVPATEFNDRPPGTRGSCDQGAWDPLGFSGMRALGVLTVFASCLVALTHSSFWQFQRMVKHITGRSAFFSYYGYGCYCGLGGKGTPVDDTDRCCLAHDCCYEKLKQIGCQPLLNSYHFHIVNSTVVCECALGPSVGCLCGLGACECDKQSAYCFKESLPTYEKNFKQFFLSRPRCGRSKLQC